MIGFLELRRQRSLQYLTLSHSFPFLRQAKGRWHTGQVFSGERAFCALYNNWECGIVW